MLFVVTSANAAAADGPTANLQLPAGFEITLFADDDLASDVYSMTVDSQGRVVVSGAGYVRILVDNDDDGTADGYIQYADGPATGAQGMYFDGRDLLCTGDEGLIRFRDADGDDLADGPAETLLPIEAGGEHHAHSIQKGPDGWWYLIAGNSAEIDEKYASSPISPVKHPQAGALLRLPPDFSNCEVFADGFRNAYDFAFNAQGDLFTYDSDGERDVSLPWYQPTRVFHVLPGSNAGWVSRSWKRPNYYFNMPPVAGAFGRGSPTGVTCYQHDRFPATYRNALFVLDWTFGRVMALPLQPDGSTWASEPVEFMRGKGHFGFAPTDVAVGPDGDLFVSVGGRGTRGGVYRIRSTSHSGRRITSRLQHARSKIHRCVDAPQPLSSWSRAEWVPLAKELGRQSFVEFALNEKAPSQHRVRAIEIITELFGGLDDDIVGRLEKSKSPEVRARTAWSLGRSPFLVDAEQLQPFLEDSHPLVARCALEALVGRDLSRFHRDLLPMVATQLRAADRFVRETAGKAIGRLDRQEMDDFIQPIPGSDDWTQISQLTAVLENAPAVDLNAFRAGMEAFEKSTRNEMKLAAVRLMQLALGDVGPAESRPPVFDGYAPRFDLSEHEAALAPYGRRLAAAYPSGDARVDREITRLASMLGQNNPPMLEKVLAKIGDDSHPVDDIHHLIVASRIPSPRTATQRERIAKALVALQLKIESRGLNQDSNWSDRIAEMYFTLLEHDYPLVSAIVKQPGFGKPWHVVFLHALARPQLRNVLPAFLKAIESDEDYRWTNEVVLLLGSTKEAEPRRIIREQVDNFAVRDAVLVALADWPEEQDRHRFLEGLSSSQFEVVSSCLEALNRLPSSEDAADQIALLSALKRLGRDPLADQTRDSIIQHLRRNTRQNFGYVLDAEEENLQQDVVAHWSAWIRSRYPEEIAELTRNHDAGVEHLRDMFADVNWEEGLAERGRSVFEKRSCAQCHGDRNAMGPDLNGVAARFSREDLFTAITDPNRVVSPRYRATLIETIQGKVYSGLVVYEAVDGVILRTSTNQTYRIHPRDIESRRMLDTSLMPVGLLKDVEPQDLADLYAYLASLGEPPRKSDLTQAD